MSVERTLSIIKPDGVEKNVIGKIISHFEDNGLVPVAMRMTTLSQAEAEGFYAVHAERPFYVLMVLEGENAIQRNRNLMGATDPAEAEDGTIRKLYATDKGVNTVHGSDAPETAAAEIGYFFRGIDLNPRDGNITAQP